MPRSVKRDIKESIGRIETRMQGMNPNSPAYANASQRLQNKQAMLQRPATPIQRPMPVQAQGVPARPQFQPQMQAPVQPQVEAPMGASLAPQAGVGGAELPMQAPVGNFNQPQPQMQNPVQPQIVDRVFSGLQKPQMQKPLGQGFYQPNLVKQGY